MDDGNPYGIVYDAATNTWWIQGNEGRVGETLYTSARAVLAAARGMQARGLDVETQHYYRWDEDLGAYWDQPVPFGLD